MAPRQSFRHIFDMPIVWSTFFLLAVMPGNLQAKSASLEIAKGQLERLYEFKRGEAKAYLMMKDTLNHSEKYFVDPVRTMVMRGPDIRPLKDLIGGMKLTVMYRQLPDGNREASIIRIDV